MNMPYIIWAKLFKSIYVMFMIVYTAYYHYCLFLPLVGAMSIMSTNPNAYYVYFVIIFAILASSHTVLLSVIFLFLSHFKACLLHYLAFPIYF